MKNEKGYVIMMVIWVAAILTVLASGLIIYVQFQQRALKNYIKSVKAYYIARAGLDKMLFTVFTQADEAEWQRRDSSRGRDGGIAYARERPFTALSRD